MIERREGGLTEPMLEIKDPLICIYGGVLVEVERLDWGGWYGKRPIKNPSHLVGSGPWRLWTHLAELSCAVQMQHA
jgi:hypothetical protein